MQSVYLDNNATTAPTPEVRRIMQDVLDNIFGNPSSGHHFGEAARSVVEKAREKAAAFLNCSPDRLIFVSGGTEGNNTVLWSGAWADPQKRHIISSVVEHPSVLGMLRHLQQKWGFDIELLPVDQNGAIDLNRLEQAIRPDTAMVSLMGANNETGVLWPIDTIGAICHARGTLFHSDTVQMAGKIPIDAAGSGIDYLTLAAHKLHGPKGCGLFYARRGVPVSPLIMGPGQENGRRGGTENVSGIAGFGEACRLAAEALPRAAANMEELRDRLENKIVHHIEDVLINGASQPRLPNTINVSLKHCSSAMITQELDEKGFAISAHSACHSGDLNPSHVLTAMNIPEPFLHGTLRISLSRYTSAEETDAFLAALQQVVQKSRQGIAL